MGFRASRAVAAAASLAIVALGACAVPPNTALPVDPAPVGGAGVSLPGPAIVEEPVSTAPPRPSPGCTAAPARTGPAGGRRTLPTGGASREFLLHVPTRATADPAPLVLSLHGLGTNAQLQQDMTGWNAVADREGIVVAYPQGVNGLWDFSPADGNADVAFLRALTTTVQAERCIDLDRTYLTGISLGGLTASVLACLSPERYAAMGLVAGIRWDPPCRTGPPRPAVVFWGSMDCVLPYFGGFGPCLAIGGPHVQPTGPVPPGRDNGFPPVEQVLAEVVAHNGCTPVPQSAMLTAAVTRRVHRQCQGSASVEFYLVEGGSHSWPGSRWLADLEAKAPSKSTAGGQLSIDIDATELMWAFFQRHPLAAG